jgi:hypothetical protein
MAEFPMVTNIDTGRDDGSTDGVPRAPTTINLT